MLKVNFITSLRGRCKIWWWKGRGGGRVGVEYGGERVGVEYGGGRVKGTVWWRKG